MKQFLRFGCYSDFEWRRKTLLSKRKSGLDFETNITYGKTQINVSGKSVIYLGKVLKHDNIAMMCVHVRLINPRIFNKFICCLMKLTYILKFTVFTHLWYSLLYVFERKIWMASFQWTVTQSIKEGSSEIITILQTNFLG